MSNVADRIASLELLLAEKETQLRRRTKHTIVFYSVAAVVIAIYTTIAASMIQELTSSATLAEHAKSWLNSELPSYRQDLVNRLEDNSNAYAKTAVRLVITEMIPSMERPAHGFLDKMSDKLAGAIEADVMPKFVEFIKADGPRLRRDYKDLKASEVGQGITLIFLSVIEKEMDTYINEHFVGATEDLQKKIHALARGQGRLTRKEDAERRALMYWAYLVEHAEIGESVYCSLFVEAKKRFKEHCGAVLGPANE